MKKLPLIFFFLFICAASPGQNYQNSFRIIGRSDGLPALQNYKVYETSDGYLWLATQNGLARYDGRQFKMLYAFYADSNSITGNVVTDLEEDGYKQLWISSFTNGFSVYNLKTGVWKQYKHPTPDGNPVYRICDLHYDRDMTMWIGTMGRGLLKYEYGQNKFTQYLLNNKLTSDGSNPDDNTVREIADDPADRNILWLACMDGLYQFNKQTGILKLYENKKTGSKSWKDNCFHAIVVSKGKFIWLGTWGGGLVAFDRETDTFTNFPYDVKNYSLNNLSSNICLDLYPASDTALYVASSDRGLLEWNVLTHQFTTVITAAKNPGESTDESILGITATSNNCLWVCGVNHIYVRTAVYNRFGNWQRLFISSTSKNVYRAQLNDALWMPGRGTYWLACSSGEGILEYDSNFHFKQSVFVENNRAKEITYRCIKRAANGKIWIQTTEHPFFYSYDSTANLFRPEYRFFHDDNFDGPISRFVIDKNNRLWTVNDSNLLVYDDLHKKARQFRFFPEPASQLKLPVTEARIAIDHTDKIWVATNIGLWSFDVNKETWEQFFPGKTNNRNSFANAIISAVTVDKNNKIWIAPSSQGIQVYDPYSKKIEKSFHISSDPSFHSPGVNYMQTAPDGNVWICTYNGLAVWQSDKRQWEWFYQSDGLRKEYADQPIIILQNGKALLAEYDGFIAFDTRHWIRNEFVPRLKITSVDIDGNPITLNDADANWKINIKPNQRRIVFSFAAIEPVFPDRVQYWYKLEGVDKDWNFASLNQVEYGSLAPGDYKYHIKAQNSDGLWSRELVIPVDVLAPFWKK